MTSPKIDAILGTAIELKNPHTHDASSLRFKMFKFNLFSLDNRHMHIVYQNQHLSVDRVYFESDYFILCEVPIIRGWVRKMDTTAHLKSLIEDYRYSSADYDAPVIHVRLADMSHRPVVGFDLMPRQGDEVMGMQDYCIMLGDHVPGLRMFED